MPKLIPIINISPDAMQAVLALETPRTPEQIESVDSGLTVQAIEIALDLAEIRIPPSDNLLEKLVEAHHQGKDISGTVIVSGKPPTPTVENEFSTYGDLDFPVFPGDAFGQIIHPIPSQDGMNVFGEIVHPPCPDKTLNSLTTSSNKSVIEKEGKFIAMHYGLVTINDGAVEINPLLKLSEDFMTLTATLYPKDYLDNRITRERMITAIRAMGVKRRINDLLFEAGLEEADQTGLPVFDTTICNGIRPFKGEDGWVEIVTDQKKEHTPGKIDRSGNIDYKDWGVVETVKEGDVLARIHLPAEGRSGRNLLAKLVPAEKGIPYSIRLGKNVNQVGNEIIATSGGLLTYSKTEIMVSEVYVVRGDVGPHTGHITVERGSVLIENSVLSGFHVSSAANILVRGTVGNSILTAGGDIDVVGGIIMNNAGLVRASGSVRALFGIGTNIQAGTNVYIMNELSKSKVTAEGSIIIAGGKGKAIGGILHCGKEIEATQIGSKLFAPTSIRLGMDDSILAEYKAEQVRLQNTLDHIQNKFNNSPDEEIMDLYPKDKRATVIHILTIREQLLNRISELGDSIVRIESQVHKKASCSLTVHGIIYPGTTIQCGTKKMQIHSPISRSKISFDFGRNQFKITGL